MLIECRFLFILHPVRLYPLTKQYERKNVAKVLELNFLAMDKFSRVSWCFISFRVAQRDALFKGDWLVLQVQSIWRSTISKVGSKSCVLSCSFLLEEWYSCKLLYGIQLQDHFNKCHILRVVNQVKMFLLFLQFFLYFSWQYYGGTNYGRLGSSFVTTRYYDEAPIDEYG